MARGSMIAPSLTLRRVVGAFAAVTLAVALVTACSSSSKPSAGGGSSTAGGSASSSMSMPMSGSDSGSGSGSAATGTNMVEVKNFAFSPASLTVPVGTTVTWKFDDSADHTVSSDDKSFVSQALSGGKTYTHTFTKAGTYPYICSIHQFMKGTIVVM
jgi:plastocyanin